MFRHANSFSAQPRARRPKRSKASAVAAVAVIGVFFCSPVAVGQDDEVLDPLVLQLIEQGQKRDAEYEWKKANVCENLDRRIADKLIRKIDRPNFSPLESDLNLIEAWEGYCKGREFDEDLIKKSLEYLLEDKKTE